VEIENDNRILAEGRHSEVRDAILEGAQKIAVPAMVSTLCICIVFLPMFSLQGVAHFLFQPLAEAVIFAMLASYLLSRTLVPTMAMYPLAMNSAQKDLKNGALRVSRLTADSVMCQTCNCPRPAVILITDQKTKAVQALCKSTRSRHDWAG
jgi:multidrug efflux pump subunit AcrB